VALSKLVRAELFGITQTDSLTYLTVAAGLAIIAVIACYLPARRVLGLDAAKVMRMD